MDTGRSFATAQNPGDLPIGSLFVNFEEDDGPLSRPQAFNVGAQRILPDEGRLFVPAGTRGGLGTEPFQETPERHRLSPSVQTHFVGDRQQPILEVPGRIVAMQVPKTLDENILGRVPGILPVAQHAPGDSQHPRLIFSDDAFECVCIAGGARGENFLVGHGIRRAS